MQITHDVSLANYSTMRLGGIAAHLCEIHSREELEEAIAWAEEQQLRVLMIGGGSNIVWRDSGFDGLLLINKISGFEDYAPDDTDHYVTVGAGENWDSVVARTVTAGLTGIEALSLIPGTAGATPIQNVGAYGQDVSQTIKSIEAYDTATHQFVSMLGADCGFGYRTSSFKTAWSGRFLITSITFHLTHGNPLPPFYGAVQEYLALESEQTVITPADLRAAVLAIRSAKLPDVSVVANNGSFFANPVVDDEALAKLRGAYPEMPHWPLDNGGAKIPAAWLLEHAGFKDIHDNQTGMATWPKQPLVLVNETAHTTADLLLFKQKIVDAVEDKFAITLEQEPELLP